MNEKIIVESDYMSEIVEFEKIFIVGPPRSGTTLVNSLLAFKLFLPECTYVTNLFKLFDEIYQYGDKERFHYYCYSLENLVEIFKKPICDFLFTAITVNKIEPTNHIILKDPVLAKYIQYFDQFFPEKYKVIYCIRDPRDLVSSMYSVLVKQNPDYQSVDLFAQTIQIVFPFYQIIYNIENFSPGYNREKIFFIKYENLVNKNKSEITKLESFIQKKVNFVKENKYIKGKIDEKSPFFSENYGKPVTTASIGNHKKVLSRDQILEIEKIFIYSMERYDYS